MSKNKYKYQYYFLNLPKNSDVLKEEKRELGKGIIESLNKFLNKIDNVQNKMSLLE